MATVLVTVMTHEPTPSFFISPPGQIFLTTMGKEKKKGIAEKIGQLQPNRSFPLTFGFFFVPFFIFG